LSSLDKRESTKWAQERVCSAGGDVLSYRSGF
jgi:hypothetical protein